jgi:hypothetical protein
MPFVTSHVSSFVVLEFRLFDEMLHTLPDDSHGTFMGTNLPAVLTHFPAFCDFLSVFEAISLPITSVLLCESLRIFTGK